MSFFLGLVSGAASAVDKQLQNDMKRTQDRIDGMGQYRVTRRRAALEQKEKDRKELREVLDQLAKFTGGDEDKAIQLYNSAGKTIAGGKDLFAELRENEKAGIDVKSALTFDPIKEGAEAANFTDFISRDIGTVTSLPVQKEEMQASGLYNLFKPDVGKQLMQQVDEEAPLPEVSVPEGLGRTAQAQIDRSQFKAATEQAELVKKREREAGMFTMAEKEFVLKQDAAALNEAKTNQAMQIARDVEARAKDKALSDEEQRKLDNARNEIADLQRQSQLIQEAELHVLNVASKKLSIAEQQDAAEKRKEHPVFTSFEDMAVYASQKLAAGGLNEQETKDFEKMYEDAVKGANDYTRATTEEDGVGGIEFSKQSLDSMVKAGIDLQLKNIPTKGIGDKVEYILKGNEADYYGGIDTALTVLTKRLTNEQGYMPPQAKRYIDELRVENNAKIYNFANSVGKEYQAAKDANKSTEEFAFVPNAEADAAVDQIMSSQNLNIRDALAVYGRDNLTKGAVVALNEEGTQYGIWTGTKFIRAKQ